MVCRGRCRLVTTSPVRWPACPPWGLLCAYMETWGINGCIRCGNVGVRVRKTGARGLAYRSATGLCCCMTEHEASRGAAPTDTMAFIHSPRCALVPLPVQTGPGRSRPALVPLFLKVLGACTRVPPRGAQQRQEPVATFSGGIDNLAIAPRQAFVYLSGRGRST